MFEENSLCLCTCSSVKKNYFQIIISLYTIILYKFIKDLDKICPYIRKNESIKKYIGYHFKIDAYITTDDIPLIFSRIKSITSNI